MNEVEAIIVLLLLFMAVPDVCRKLKRPALMYSAYVVFGKQQEQPWPAVFDLSALDGNTGFAILGLTQGDAAGSAVSAAGPALPIKHLAVNFPSSRPAGELSSLRELSLLPDEPFAPPEILSRGETVRVAVAESVTLPCQVKSLGE